MEQNSLCFWAWAFFAHVVQPIKLLGWASFSFSSSTFPYYATMAVTINRLSRYHPPRMIYEEVGSQSQHNLANLTSNVEWFQAFT